MWAEHLGTQACWQQLALEESNLHQVLPGPGSEDPAQPAWGEVTGERPE